MVRATLALELAAIALVAVLAAVAGRRAACRWPRVSVVVAAAGVAGFAWQPLVHFVLPALYALPQPLAITVDLLQAAGFLLAGVGWERVRGRPRGRVLLSVLIILGVWHVFKDSVSRVQLGPGLAALGHAPAGARHPVQTTPYTCVPACAAAALARFGVSASEGEMAFRCRTSRFGTDPFRLVRAVREAAAARGVRLECEVRTRLGPADLPGLPAPAFLSVRVANLGHAVLYLGPWEKDRSAVLVADPLRPGVQCLSVPVFVRDYRWDGEAVLVRRAR